MWGVCLIAAAQNFRSYRFRQRSRRIRRLDMSRAPREPGTGWRLRPDTHARRSRDARRAHDTSRAASIENMDLHPSEGRARSSHRGCRESSLRSSVRRPYPANVQSGIVEQRRDSGAGRREISDRQRSSHPYQVKAPADSDPRGRAPRRARRCEALPPPGERCRARSRRGCSPELLSRRG